MKDQVYNKGELKELKVMIEKDVVDALERMATVANISAADMVVIALRRYQTSHSDWDPKKPTTQPRSAQTVNNR